MHSIGVHRWTVDGARLRGYLCWGAFINNVPGSPPVGISSAQPCLPPRTGRVCLIQQHLQTEEGFTFSHIFFESPGIDYLQHGSKGR